MNLPVPITIPDVLEDARTIFGALAPATQKRYEEVIRGYAADGYEPNGRSLAQWVDWKREQGLAPSTLRSSVAAIRKLAAVLDVPITGRDDQLVKAALRRASRENRHKGPGSVAGVSWEQADLAAEKAARAGEWRGLRDAAIIRLASDALLRVSEIASLDVEDLRLDDSNGGRIYLKSSKTDQYGKGAWCYIGPPTVDALCDWLNLTGIDSGPVFRSERGRNHGERLSSDSVRNAMVNRLRDIGIEGRIGGHSFRRGSAASLVKAGASLVEIQDAGRWIDSNMVRRYCAGQLAEQGIVGKYRYGGK